jgi:hypothetical protein
VSVEWGKVDGRTGNVEVHAEAGGAERVTFGFKATAGVDDVLAAILRDKVKEGSQR